MLFIYGAMSLGGIETFFLRMAMTRAKSGKKTKLLLLREMRCSDLALINEIKKYADVCFLEDYVIFPRWMVRIIPFHFLLLLPLRFKRMEFLFHGVSQVHVPSAIYGFFYMRLVAALNVSVPLTVGVYHSKEFIWGKGIPFYERLNRKFFFDVLSVENLIFFNESVVAAYEKYSCLNLAGANIFPIGVVDFRDPTEFDKLKNSEKILIGTVGRLVEFKSYNLWIVNVVEELIALGFNVQCVIYGDGPLFAQMEKNISAKNLFGKVILAGGLEYSKFKNIVSEFDIFIGSGTAIVEAASLGVPSIIGIESVVAPLTYGFLSEIKGFSYNEDGLYEKVSVVKEIAEYLATSELYKQGIRRAHIEKSNIFSMQSCVANFEAVTAESVDEHLVNKYAGLYFRIVYSFSFFIFSLSCRIRGRSLSDVVYG